MIDFYPRASWLMSTALLLAPMGAVFGQAPVITSIIPMANARAAARTSPVTVNFNQPLTAASAGALKVFSSQRGGLRTRGATPAVVNGSALSFAPTTYPFMPGETVQYTVTTAAAGSNGPLATARVGQFTTAVGGTGNGNFQAGSTPSVGSEPTYILTGDVDGDGDLDLINNLLNSPFIGVRLNSGAGAFSGSQSYIPIPNPAHSVSLGDVDGDGDLDLVAATQHFSGAAGAINVRLNDGTGTFGPGPDLAITGPSSPVLGDIDGDGDIDILAASHAGPGTPVPVRIHLNDGAGLFSNAPDVLIPYGAGSLALGDMDNDGDLDLVNFVNYSPGIVTVLLNAGGGTFTGSYSSSTGYGSTSFTTRNLGDVDGDGDLDLMLSDYSSSGVQFLFNTGNGSFSGGSNLLLGGGYSGVVSGGLTSVALGDVDGDGDLDLAGTNTYFQSTGPPPGKVSIRLNNGRGTFGSGLDVAVAYNPYSVTLGDVDGDGDLDLIAACASTNLGRASVLLNQPGLVTAALTATAATAFSLFPNPAHGAATLTGMVPNTPLTVFDALGRVLLTATADAAGAARLVLPEGLPTGVYLVRSGGQVHRLELE